MDYHQDIQEALGRSYTIPDDIDEDVRPRFNNCTRTRYKRVMQRQLRWQQCLRRTAREQPATSVNT